MYLCHTNVRSKSKAASHQRYKNASPLAMTGRTDGCTSTTFSTFSARSRASCFADATVFLGALLDIANWFVFQLKYLVVISSRCFAFKGGRGCSIWKAIIPVITNPPAKSMGRICLLKRRDRRLPFVLKVSSTAFLKRFPSPLRSSSFSGSGAGRASEIRPILAIAPTSKGLGFAVLSCSKGQLLDWGVKYFEKDKNENCVGAAARLIRQYNPHVFSLQDFWASDARRSKRIQELGWRLVVLARERQVKVSEILWNL